MRTLNTLIKWACDHEEHLHTQTLSITSNPSIDLGHRHLLLIPLIVNVIK